MCNYLQNVKLLYLHDWSTPNKNQNHNKVTKILMWINHSDTRKHELRLHWKQMAVELEQAQDVIRKSEKEALALLTALYRFELYLESPLTPISLHTRTRTH